MKKGVLQVGEHGVMFYCKGCDMLHSVNLDIEYSPITWDFNGNYEKPTFTPSVLVEYPWGPEKVQMRCHSFVTDGKVQYLSDCTHELAGQIVDLEDGGYE